MDLAALKVSQTPAWPVQWGCGDCLMLGRRKLMFGKLLLSQVDVKNRSVISIHVQVHGALLRRKADGTVLQGEGGAGCDVIPEKHGRTLTCRQT